MPGMATPTGAVGTADGTAGGGGVFAPGRFMPGGGTYGCPLPGTAFGFTTCGCGNAVKTGPRPGGFCAGGSSLSSGCGATGGWNVGVGWNTGAAARWPPWRAARGRDGRHHENAIEPRQRRRLQRPRRREVAAQRPHQNVERLSFGHVLQLERHRSAGNPLDVDHFGLTDAGPLGHDLPQRRVLGDDRHAAIMHRDLHFGRRGGGGQQRQRAGGEERSKLHSALYSTSSGSSR